jgi:hypothetical protein
MPPRMRAAHRAPRLKGRPTVGFRRETSRIDRRKRLSHHWRYPRLTKNTATSAVKLGCQSTLRWPARK